MADTANTVTSLQPLLKESYFSKAMRTHERPGLDHKTKGLFPKLKDKLKAVK